MKSNRIAQAKINRRNSEKRLIKRICDNFTENDIVLTLTYMLPPGNVEEAQRRLSNFLRRLKRLRTKQGLETLKYITVTEAEEREGGIWHHVIMNAGLEGYVLQKLWRMGIVNIKHLQFGEDGYSGLAMYFVKDRQTYKHWNSSRNFIFPH